jgi:hypothetical protein
MRVFHGFSDGRWYRFQCPWSWSWSWPWCPWWPGPRWWIIATTITVVVDRGVLWLFYHYLWKPFVNKVHMRVYICMWYRHFHFDPTPYIYTNLNLFSRVPENLAQFLEGEEPTKVCLCQVPPRKLGTIVGCKCRITELFGTREVVGQEVWILYLHLWVWVFPSPSIYYSRFVFTMVDEKIHLFPLYIRISKHNNENIHIHACKYKNISLGQVAFIQPWEHLRKHTFFGLDAWLV